MTRFPDWRAMGNEEKIVILREHAKNGLSSGQIAAQFQYASRSAVCGFMHRNDIPLKSQGRAATRLSIAGAKVKQPRPHPGNIARKAASRKFDPGLKFGKQQLTETKPKKAHAAPVPKAEIASAKGPAPDLAALEPISRARAFDPLPGLSPVLLTDIKPNQCHWPVNGLDGSEPIFCGGHASHLYCSSHARLSYKAA